jgi:hypothetical protein
MLLSRLTRSSWVALAISPIATAQTAGQVLFFSLDLRHDKDFQTLFFQRTT